MIQFNVGDVRVTHTIRINQDQVCETDPDEVFFSDIALGSGMQPIIVIRPTAEITIEDSAEPECSEISKHNTHVHSLHEKLLDKSTLLFSIHGYSHFALIFNPALNRSHQGWLRADSVHH